MTVDSVGSFLVVLVNVIFQLASLAILARVILSWLPMAGVQIDPDSPIIRFLYNLTDPLLNPLRRITTFGAIDFSPIAALILLEVARHVLESILQRGAA